MGKAGIGPGTQTRLAYQVRADHLAPWLKLAHTAGDGNMSLDGSVGGALRTVNGPDLHAQGAVDFQAVHLASLRTANVRIDYDFARIGQPGWPRGAASAQLTALEVNRINLRALSAQVRTTGGQPAQTKIVLGLRDNQNNSDHVEATLVYFPHRITGKLEQLLVVLPDGTWRLAHAAGFARDERHVALEHFMLINGARQLTLDASLAATGAQAVALHARTLDLALLQPFMPPGQQLTGDLSADVAVGGTSTAPSIKTSLQARGLMTNTQRVGDLDAAMKYISSAAELDLILHQDRNINSGSRGASRSTFNGLTDSRRQSATMNRLRFTALEYGWPHLAHLRRRRSGMRAVCYSSIWHSAGRRSIR